MRKICSAIAAMFLIASGGIAVADGSGDPTAVKQNETGEWSDKEGNPTYKITEGSVDWYTSIPGTAAITRTAMCVTARMEWARPTPRR
ncbi:hypothetical protein ACVWWG_000936 [Bradyrhizobium sp. LB7.2]